MQIKNLLKNWTPQHFLGISVFMVMGLCALILSQNQPDSSIKIESVNYDDPDFMADRNPAKVRDLNQHLAMLNRDDRNWLGSQIKSRRCYSNIDARNTSCTMMTNWRNGDPSFNWNPYYNRIPRGTKAIVDIQCDPASGQFRTNVVLPNVCPNICTGHQRGETCRSQNSQCENLYFNSPYDDGVGPFSRHPTAWLTSPGAFNRLDFSHFRRIPDSSVLAEAGGDLRKMNTAGRIPAGGSNAVNELHVVSGKGRTADWAGAKMTNTIWLNGDFAIHGSETVTGRPASRGCMRLQPNNAKALYDLARRIGTANIEYRFGGYGPHSKAIGGPACSLSEEQWRSRGLGGSISTNISASEEAKRNRQSANSKNIFTKFFSWLGGAFKGGGSREAAPSSGTSR